MRNRRENRRFLNSSFYIGIAIILISILLGSYFFNDEVIDYKEFPDNTLIEDEHFYSDSEITDWHKINLRRFRIHTPKPYRFFIRKGIDNYAGGITNQIDTLLFLYGWHADDLSDYDILDNTQTFYERINGRRFKIVSETRNNGIVGAFTDDLEGYDTFVISCQDCNEIDEKLRMIRTIEF